MVKTKAEIKVKIGEWIEQQDERFTTQDVKNAMREVPSNIHLSPNRLTKYIRATGKAEFDPREENWKVRLKPFKKVAKD